MLPENQKVGIDLSRSLFIHLKSGIIPRSQKNKSHKWESTTRIKSPKPKFATAWYSLFRMGQFLLRGSDHQRMDGIDNLEGCYS